MHLSPLQLARFRSALLGLALLPVCLQAEPLELLPRAEVDSDGVFLKQIVAPTRHSAPPDLKLAPSPQWGAELLLNRSQLSALLAKASPLLQAEFSGAPEIRISRRSRKLEEPELLLLLADRLQELSPRSGELEIRLRQEWKPIDVPVESIDLRIVSRHHSGLNANFIARFDIVAGPETVGTFTANIQASLFQEVWVARSTVRRGTALSSADLARERRDVIHVRETLWDGVDLDPAFCLGETVVGGNIIYARAIEPRPVIFRGQQAQAVVQDSSLYISLPVQALEDGAPGQIIRARNLRSRKEIRGKVINEDTIQVLF